MKLQAVKHMLGDRSPVFAMGDQLAMVGGNFLLGAMVARAGSFEVFAHFSVLYALLVLLNALHGPLLNEPLVLQSALLPRHQVPSSLPMTALLFAPLLCIAPMVMHVGMAWASIPVLLGWSAAGAGSVCYWSVKAELHCAGEHRAAFMLSVAVASAMLVLALVLLYTGWPPILSALSSIALASAGCTLVSVAKRRSGRRTPLAWRDVRRQAWVGIGSALMLWLAANVTLLWLVHAGRESDASGLRAVLALLLPINQVMVGLSSFLLPKLARQQQQAPTQGRPLLPILVACILPALLFALAIQPLALCLLVRIYGSDYSAYERWLQVGAMVLPVCWVTVTVLRTQLRAQGRGRQLLLAYAAALVLGLTASWPALAHGESLAPMVAFCIVQLAVVIALTVTLFRREGKADGR